MIRRHVLVTGRVQGVFYRDTCRREACAAGVTGWVRNLPDGRVEATFEGDPQAVDGLLEWAQRGPESAAVDHMTVNDEQPVGDTEFVVR
ncbi:acylphosphatase [Streptomyces spiramenti]|uniref:acylphosphatase n=1 Tax=Streptomyces spiramenti TaxID=2720606 RepID=A0ABX1AM02_9ACTN|nr:acylphosphatase [Streptomyces spiramenti]NJP68139.1 acylphosphatase [Streptomyces spiramenti]